MKVRGSLGSRYVPPVGFRAMRFVEVVLVVDGGGVLGLCWASR